MEKEKDVRITIRTPTNHMQAQPNLPDAVNRNTTNARYVVVRRIKPLKSHAQNDDIDRLET